ncbi:MAG: glycerophosphodiester phosphodiesterase [Thermodesulfobacteriota bacterium]
MGPILVIAHRGAHATAPENSLAAFQAAMDLGADMIELDLRRTQDGRLVVHHDADLNGAPLAGLSFAQAQALGGGVLAPALEEVLELTRGRIRLDIEIKEPGYEEAAARRILEFLAPEQFMLSSFLEPSLIKIKRGLPNLCTGLLLPPPGPGGWPSPLERCRRARADVLLPHYKLLRAGPWPRAKKLGRPIYVWTVNSQRLLAQFMAGGQVQGVITDRPADALRLREGAPA